MKRLTAIIITVVCCASLRGQSNTYGNGIVPYRAYDFSKIGVVDLKTRHLTLNIPLLSFKQKGALPDISVSFVYNSSRWAYYIPDEASGNLTYWWGPYSASSFVIGMPSSPVPGGLVTRVGGMYTSYPVNVLLGNNQYANYEYVSSMSGPTSLVGTDSSSSLSGMTVDGTGNAVTSSGITDKNGVSYNLRYCSVSSSYYCLQTAGYIKDSIGNQITLNYPSGASSGPPTSFTDSIGRTFNYFSNVNNAGDYINFYPINSATSLEIRQSAHAISTALPNIGTAGTYQYTDTWVLIDSITLPNGTQWGFHYNTYGDIYQIDLPTGGTISYNWDSVADPDDPTAYDRVVTGRTESDGTNNYTWSYTDQRAQWPSYTSSAIVVTDPNNNDTAYIAGGPCMRDLEVDYFQGFFSLPSYGGSPCTPSAPNLLKSEYTTYGESTARALYSPSSVYGVQLPSQKVSTWPDGQTLETDYTYDSSLTWVDPNYQVAGSPPITQSYSTGSLKSVKEYDYGTSGAGALIRQTVTTFQWEQPNPAYLTANLLNIPYSVVIQDGTGTAVAEQNYIYDESSYSAVSGAAGLNTTLNNGLPGQQVTTHTYFNSDGMASGSQDGRNYVSSISYECGGLVPYQLINPLKQPTTLGCDLNTGNVTSVQDPNGASTGYTYTSVNDPLTITFPDTGNITYDYHGYATPLHVTRTQTAAPDPSIVTDTYFDGLGRPIKVVTAGIETDTQYDGLGQVISVSNPSAGAPTQYTTYAYDALGRKLLQCNQDNGTGNGKCSQGLSYRQWSYSGNRITFSDENRNTWQWTYDALGRMMQVTEPNNANTYYTYDANGNLICAAQDGGNGGTFTTCANAPASWRPRTFSYDSLSRLLCASNPENSTATCPAYDHGTWLPGTVGYTYDGNGNVSSKTDARGITTTYSYDALNRLTGKTYSGGSAAATASSCYQYDTNGSSSTDSNFIGRLVNEWTIAGACSATLPTTGYLTRRSILEYDPMGRVEREQQCHLAHCTSGVPYDNTSDYDLAGNLTSFTSNVHSIAFAYSYDAVGRLLSLGSNWIDSTHPASLLSVGSYSPTGAIQSMTLGPNINVTRTYDNRLRIAGETAQHP